MCAEFNRSPSAARGMAPMAVAAASPFIGVSHCPRLGVRLAALCSDRPRAAGWRSIRVARSSVLTRLAGVTGGRHLRQCVQVLVGWGNSRVVTTGWRRGSDVAHGWRRACWKQGAGEAAADGTPLSPARAEPSGAGTPTVRTVWAWGSCPRWQLHLRACSARRLAGDLAGSGQCDDGHQPG